MIKSEKGPASASTIEKLSDMEWVHSFVRGVDNGLVGSLSRFPMPGPRALAPLGPARSFDELLAILPERFKSVRKVHAGCHTPSIKTKAQVWRTETNPIDIHSVSPLRPAPVQDLILAAPDAADAARSCAQLLLGPSPFAALIPTDLAPQTYRKDLFPDIRVEKKIFNRAGKLVLLEADMAWVIGNIKELETHREVFNQQLFTVAPLVESLHSFRLSKSPPLQAMSKNVHFKTESLTNYDVPLRGMIPNPSRAANARGGLGGGGSPRAKPLRGIISNHNRAANARKGCGGSGSPCATNLVVKEDAGCGANQAAAGRRSR
jgi:hypothetical protein